MASAFDAWQVELHGHRVIYRVAGSGPPIVLIHGMVNSSRHWEDVALRLAKQLGVATKPLPGGSGTCQLFVIVGPARGPGE